MSPGPPVANVSFGELPTTTRFATGLFDFADEEVFAWVTLGVLVVACSVLSGGHQHVAHGLFAVLAAVGPNRSAFGARLRVVTSRPHEPATPEQLVGAMLALGVWEGETTLQQHDDEARRLGGAEAYRLSLCNALLGAVQAQAARGGAWS